MRVRLPPGVRRLLRLRTSARDALRELDDEVRLHLQLRAEELRRGGMDPDTAREEALRRFDPDGGGMRRLARGARRGEYRRRAREVLGGLGDDLGSGLRRLLRSPRTSVPALLILMAVFGANAAAFGVADHLLFRPPAHVVEPSAVKRVFVVERRAPGDPTVTSTLSFPDYLALRDGAADVQVAAMERRPLSWGRGPEAWPVDASVVTRSFFDLLGTRPALGRFFSEADPEEPAVVVSHAFWQTRLAGDPDVLGRELRIGEGHYRVVGVAPPGFTGVHLTPVDVWLPMELLGPELAGPNWRTHGWGWLYVLVRSPDPERQTALEARLAGAYQATGQPDRAGATVALWPATDGRGPHGTLEGRVALWTAAVGLAALLAAVVNLWNLLLARGLRRRGDVGVRLALGASRGRVARELFAEVILLVVIAGTGGLAAGHVALRLAGALLPEVVVAGAVLDLRIAGFTAAMVLLAATGGTLLPAMQAGRGDLTRALRVTGSDRAGGLPHLRLLLVGTQFAVCTLLVAGSLLFLRSLHNVATQEMGFDADRVTLVMLHHGIATSMSVEDEARLYRLARERVLRIPGVEAAALSTSVPFAFSTSVTPHVPGLDSLPRLDRAPEMAAVGEGYFTTMGTPLVRGRFLGPQDATPVPGGVLVNRTMERLLWGPGGAVGRCLHLWDADDPCVPVVGVVEDVRGRGVMPETVMQYFVPLESEIVGAREPALLVRSADAAALVPHIRATVQGLAPDLPYALVRPLDEIIEPQIRSWRLGSAAFTGLGVVVVLIVTVGLYGVLAFEVRRRRGELGIRLALGARPWRLLAGMVTRALLVAAGGGAAGLAAILLARDRLEPLLFGVSPADPTLLGGAVAGLFLVAVLASGGPALQAASTDPAMALREL